MFSDIIHYFNAGGIVMYPLVLLLIIVGMIGIERVFFYNTFRKDAVRLHKNAMSAEDTASWNDLIALFNEAESPLMSAVYLVTNNTKNRTNLESRYDDLVTMSAMDLKKGLDWVSMVVTMAPLLGLLGTVIGMIRSFQVIGGGTGAPLVITGGVGEALVATATGLCVALVALMIHSYCAHVANGLISFMEFNLGRMLDLYDGNHED